MQLAAGLLMPPLPHQADQGGGASFILTGIAWAMSLLAATACVDNREQATPNNNVGEGNSEKIQRFTVVFVMAAALR
ncbi:MAG: hypothetical protein HZT40_04935 [Candidatus Thiothrix singaporensis]|uniref:Uncharacterized protein n=1 Tax=Candidatus Thiothrix singaporensis TaxID=2799669 RepID=A0A7L6APQ8_9GAMM|nr:MAG: hypothetical protein HZT40_04935 [Candidatus Thiothrix singaporensis]